MSDQPLVGDHIEQLQTYQPDEPLDVLEERHGLDEIVKLSSNENYLGPSPAAERAIREATSQLSFYPEGGHGAGAHRAIAEFHGVPVDRVLTANGSNEVLTLAARTFAEARRHTAVVPEYGFAVHRLVCRAQDVSVRAAEMGPEFEFDLETMLDAVDERTKLVFLANPNNPTGTYVPRRALRTFLESVPDHVVVVVDEAYYEYAEAGAEDYASALEMTGARDRLLVTRSFSKCYGLAGLRAGYAIAPPPMVERMNRVREPFTSNALAQAAVPAALGDREFVRFSEATNEEGKRVLEEGLEALSEYGVDWIPSETNFLLVRVPDNASDVAAELVERGVLVRSMGGYGLKRHARISVADPPRMRRCVDALESVVSGS